MHHCNAKRRKKLVSTLSFRTWPRNTDMLKRVSSHVNIKHCSLCPGTTEYYCHDCECDLCRPCKEIHVDILDIKRHNVSIYGRKLNNDLRCEMCPEHPHQAIEMYCELCDLPACLHCRKHRQHKLQNIRTAYENKRMKFNHLLINTICETIYNRQILLNELKSDFTTCQKEMDQLKFDMFTMSKRLKDSLDNVQLGKSLKYKTFLVCRFLKQKKRMKRNIARIQKYEHKYEKSANRPVKFLRFIKTLSFSRILTAPRLSERCLLTLTQKIDMDYLIKLLSEIKITESGKQRREKGELQLTLMPSPLLQKSLSVTGVGDCDHISCVTPNRLWVSDGYNLILIDTTTGEKLFILEDFLKVETGKHMVNSDRELIYIDKHYNLCKLSSDMKTTTLLIDNPDPAWTPKCVYCSPSSGDLLVGMIRYDTHTYKHTGKVMRYNNTGRHTKTIPQNTLDNLYRNPRYITENNNGDVLVSDGTHYALVVTTQAGVHRFSYKGPPPSESGLFPHGVCTDALSHILVCDPASHTVQMLSQDGAFLKYLLTIQSSDIVYPLPCGLSYDFHTHCLWVGLATKSPWHGKTLSVYRHINRHPPILGSSEYPKTYF